MNANKAPFTNANANANSAPFANANATAVHYLKDETQIPLDGAFLFIEGSFDNKGNEAKGVEAKGVEAKVVEAKVVEAKGVLNQGFQDYLTTEAKVTDIGGLSVEELTEHAKNYRKKYLPPVGPEVPPVQSLPRPSLQSISVSPPVQSLPRPSPLLIPGVNAANARLQYVEKIYNALDELIAARDIATQGNATQGNAAQSKFQTKLTKVANMLNSLRNPPYNEDNIMQSIRIMSHVHFMDSELFNELNELLKPVTGLKANQAEEYRGPEDETRVLKPQNAASRPMSASSSSDASFLETPASTLASSVASTPLFTPGSLASPYSVQFKGGLGGTRRGSRK